MTVKRSFTLIELLIVIAIIGILSAVLLPAAMEAVVRSQIKGVTAEMVGLRAALEEYFGDYGRYPYVIGAAEDATLGLLDAELDEHYGCGYCTEGDKWLDRWGQEIHYIVEGAEWTTVDNTDANASYTGTWVTDAPSWSYGNTRTYTSQWSAGDYVEFDFTGTGVRMYSDKSSSRGVADVYIDDVLQGSFDGFARDQSGSVKVCQKTGLTNGAHTLKVVAITQTYLVVDAFAYTTTEAADYPSRKVVLISDGPDMTYGTDDDIEVK